MYPVPAKATNLFQLYKNAGIIQIPKISMCVIRRYGIHMCFLFVRQDLPLICNLRRKQVPMWATPAKSNFTLCRDTVPNLLRTLHLSSTKSSIF